MNAPTEQEHRRKAHSVRAYPKTALANTDLQMQILYSYRQKEKTKIEKCLDSTTALLYLVLHIVIRCRKPWRRCMVFLHLAISRHLSTVLRARDRHGILCSQVISQAPLKSILRLFEWPFTVFYMTRKSLSKIF